MRLPTVSSAHRALQAKWVAWRRLTKCSDYFKNGLRLLERQRLPNHPAKSSADRKERCLGQEHKMEKTQA